MSASANWRGIPRGATSKFTIAHLRAFGGAISLPIRL